MDSSFIYIIGNCAPWVIYINPRDSLLSIAFHCLFDHAVMTVERPSQDLVDLLCSKGYLYLAGNNEDGQETACGCMLILEMRLMWWMGWKRLVGLVARVPSG